MPTFFRIGDNSIHTRGTPCVERILNRPPPKPCPTCRRSKFEAYGPLHVKFQRDKGVKWPDALGGATRFILSERALESLRKDLSVDIPVFPATIEPPLPKKLEGTPPPAYFCVNGEAMTAAELDFEASGYVAVEFCGKCGVRTHDITATSKKRHEESRPYAFKENTWTGAELFTTNLSSGAFFCTDAVLESARRHQLTNLRFIPVEAGPSHGSKGIDYLGRKWPPAPFPLRPSDGKTLDKWLELYDAGPANKQWYDAYCALLDLYEDALPAVLKRMRTCPKEQRGRWSRVLDSYWTRGAKLPTDALEAIEEDGPFH